MKLEIKNLYKNYGETEALKNINVTLEEGIYGLLGANGAGKSTLLNLITDNISRDRGEILFDGQEILKMNESFRSLIGFMPQEQGLYEYFSARLFLLYMAELKGIPKKNAKEEIDRLLKMVHLDKVSHKKLKSFSGGMKQRVLLAQALLGNPKILILDEPTSGLDPKERISFRNMVYELSTDKIIIFSTHIVEDIECISDYVLLLKKGELIMTGTPTHLINSIVGKVGETACSKYDINELRQLYPIGSFTQKKDNLIFRIIGDYIPNNFTVVKDDISLEDVYLYYFEFLND